MTMVLTPILKSSTPDKINNSSSTSRVKFNLPDESNIVEYLRSDGLYSPYSVKVNTFIKRINDPDTEHAVLLKWIQDFKDNILFLEKHERIVNTLLNLNWCAKDDTFVNIYQELILNIVTAHPSYLKNVLMTIIKVFYTVQDCNEEKISDSEEKYFLNGHKLLQNIITLVPTCESLLCELLVQKFPYMKNPTKTLLCYIQNLFHLCSYLPHKRLTVLGCIVEKLIHIDVNCTREKIEMAEDEHNEENNLPMVNCTRVKIEMAEDKHNEENNLPMDQDLIGENIEVEKMALPLAHTLDAVLEFIFQYVQKTCFPEGQEKLDWEATKKLYKEFLTAFDKINLPTHGSHHVQYIMFYICSLKQELSEGFLDYLWKKVQNPSIGSVFRQLASFYIGSFLSRAKYINISTVTACLDLMCRWIHSYIDNHTSQDLNVHGTFHSVCQTVFYVFAFRSQELLEFDKGYKFLRSLNFDRIVTCCLNPLRYCDKDIVQNFANIARNYQIAYVYPVIERNNRNLLYSDEKNSGSFPAGAKIQTCFPFDPYILKRSKKWVELNYRVYNHCQKDESMDVTDEVDTNVCDSIFTYGTSPGFKKSWLRR